LLTNYLKGTGPFAELGELVYDDYWMYYLTADMARNAEIKRPYNNLKTYAEYKQLGASIDKEKIKQLEMLDTGPSSADTDEEVSVEEDEE
jgi:Restriction endonuclease EcoRV